MMLKKIDQAEYLPVNFKITDPLSAQVWIICTAAIFLVSKIIISGKSMLRTGIGDTKISELWTE